MPPLTSTATTFGRPQCHEGVTTQPKLPGKLARTVADLGGLNSQVRHPIEPTASDALGHARTGRSCLRSRRPQVRILPGAPSDQHKRKTVQDSCN